MNIALDHIKDEWAATQNCDHQVSPQQHANVVILCCVIKALVGWHIGDVTKVTRERCGGQVSSLLSFSSFNGYVDDRDT